MPEDPEPSTNISGGVGGGGEPAAFDPAAADTRAERVVDRLGEIYWQKSYGGQDAFPCLVRTILSQNTSDVASQPAHDALVDRYSRDREVDSGKRGDLAAALAVADQPTLAETISSAGLYNQKSNSHHRGRRVGCLGVWLWASVRRVRQIGVPEDGPGDTAVGSRCRSEDGRLRVTVRRRPRGRLSRRHARPPYFSPTRNRTAGCRPRGSPGRPRAGGPGGEMWLWPYGDDPVRSRVLSGSQPGLSRGSRRLPDGRSLCAGWRLSGDRRGRRSGRGGLIVGKTSCWRACGNNGSHSLKTAAAHQLEKPERLEIFGCERSHVVLVVECRGEILCRAFVAVDTEDLLGAGIHRLDEVL